MNYTSIEQSKKLLSLGLKPESADMHWLNLPSVGDIAVNNPYVKNSGATEGLLPCWSVGALLEVMPKEKEVPFSNSNPFVGFGDNTYRCVYLNGDWESSHQETGTTLIEASYNMVVWLLENNYIK